MTDVTLSSQITTSKNIFFREMEGEAVLLNADTGIYFGLDATGTVMWHAMQKQKRLHQVLQAVLEEFDVDPKRCGEDLIKFTSSLQKNGLLQVHAD